MVPTRFPTIRWAWVSIAMTGCGLLSCASGGADAADGVQNGVQNGEAETSEPGAPTPNVASEPEPEVPEPGVTAPSAALMPDPPDREPQQPQDPTPDVADPDPAHLGEGAAGESGEDAAAGAPHELPSAASGGASGSHAGARGGVDGGPAGVGGAAGSPLPEMISFAQVEAAVFEPAGCTGGYCHGASAGDLSWSYAELVGAAATQPGCGLTERVVAGDPEASILWQRVRPLEEQTESCGAAMPMGGLPPLTEEQAQLVYDWIAGGAAP
jgi:hypothetical protein